MKFKKIDKDAITPTFGSCGSAGMDLYACNGIFIPSGTQV